MMEAQGRFPSPLSLVNQHFDYFADCLWEVENCGDESDGLDGCAFITVFLWRLSLARFDYLLPS